MHLEIQMERMKRKYNVTVETERPRISYRETITMTGEAQGRYKKQTGGRGQFGDCWVRLKPLPRGSGYQFNDAIKGGVIPGKFIPSVDKGIQEAARRGVLAGFPLVDFVAECYDGSYHTVDSSDIAFQLAGGMAFRKVVEAARPKLLEPMIEISVTTPDEYVGDIMGDITQRRGKVLGMDPGEGRTVIKANVPEAELYKYASTLRSMTQGRAYHTRRFIGHEFMPDLDAQKVIAEHKKDVAEEH
jgi:elongation factor G